MGQTLTADFKTATIYCYLLEIRFASTASWGNRPGEAYRYGCFRVQTDKTGCRQAVQGGVIQRYLMAN